MRKNIKNYTTSISVTKTLGEIQELLSKKKAQKIMIDYENGMPVSVAFLLQVGERQVPIRLPARIQNCGLVMFPSRSSYRQATWDGLNDKQKEQASRTAWRNIKDWIDAQIALVETEMVKMEEVFLPYVVMGKQTVFENFISGNLQLGSGE